MFNEDKRRREDGEESDVGERENFKTSTKELLTGSRSSSLLLAAAAAKVFVTPQDSVNCGTFR